METMTIKRCSGSGSGSSSEKKSSTTYFYVWMRDGLLKMFKVDPHRIDFNILEGELPPPMKPFFSMDGFPVDAATAAVGSKIYIIGGSATGFDDRDDLLPRVGYAIDMARDRPKVVNLPPMRWGKSKPSAFTINGKIYVMPNSFSGFTPYSPLVPGKYFECYDPETNSWTLLPRPPLPHSSHPLQVTSHAVLGSTLLISFGTDLVFSFNTLELWWIQIKLDLGSGVMLHSLPFHHPSYASIRGQEILCSPNRDGWVPKPFRELMARVYNINISRDYYVCRFEDIDHDDIVRDRGVVKVSILPFDSSSMRLTWGDFVRHSPPELLFPLETGDIGDGLVLVTKVGHDFEDLSLRDSSPPPDYPDPENYFNRTHSRNRGCKVYKHPNCYCTFELFRVGTFQASTVASSVFLADFDLLPFDYSVHSFRCFAMEDGIFIN